MMRIVAFAVCVSLCECQYRQFHQREEKIKSFLHYEIIVRATVAKVEMFSYVINTTQVYRAKNATLKVYVYKPPFDERGPKVHLKKGKEYLLGGNPATYYNFPVWVTDNGEITCNPCYYEPWSPWMNEFLTRYIR
ncbi:unnamed protein product [Cylicocyclus nassatus]|uniref:Uncharacterized protein n=1 Tax=Cylicocyclus nassatus TaxID=53992 RepID=A0AA36M566_CYLNA|nr:unnamed protein product [Cylicocyclus nassatus]